MPSPEHGFQQPRVVFAPDNKTGSNVSDKTGAEHPQQQDSLAENSQFSGVDQHSTHFIPRTSSPLDFTPKVVEDGEQNSQKLERPPAFKGEESIQSDLEEQVEYVKPIAGGSPEKGVNSLSEEVVTFYSQGISVRDIADHYGYQQDRRGNVK